MRGSLPRRTGRGRAPGKVILLGEHAVVYGRTAIAASIDRHVALRVCAARPRAPATSWARPGAPARGAQRPPLELRTAAALRCAGVLLEVDTTRLDVAIASDVPAGVGLGSSAAVSVAMVRALADFTGRALDDGAVCAAALELEKVFHGFPSGVDNSAAAYGGLIAFRRGAVRRLALGAPLTVVLALSSAPRRTRAVVAALRRRRARDAARHESLFAAIGALAHEAEHAVAGGDRARLGELMSCNHALLRELGVSTGELDAMVALARAHGAFGAKLTGGGGGGAIVCLPDDGGQRLVDVFAAAGWQAFVATIDPRGMEPHVLANHAVAR